MSSRQRCWRRSRAATTRPARRSSGCSHGSRREGWLGDDELATEAARVLRGEAGPLRPTPVDLDELAHHLEGPQGDEEGWRLEVATGQLWPDDPEMMSGEDAPQDFDDPDAFPAVFWGGPHLGYADMRDFIGRVTDDALASRLDDAIRGRGAFRRFRDELHRHERWRGEWFTFSDERRRGRARWWLSEIGLRPATDAER